MSGRLEQLARQIRRLRTRAPDPARTLQRALHLAVDLANEHDAPDFAALAERGILARPVADRLASFTDKRLDDRDVTDALVIDLDVFLRSIELGAPAPALELPPLGSAPKLPPGTQRASVNVSGRVISVVGRDGRAFVLIDDRPIGQPFDLISVPTAAHTLTRDPDGSVCIEWPRSLRLIVAPDFASVRIERA